MNRAANHKQDQKYRWYTLAGRTEENAETQYFTMFHAAI